MVNCESGVKQQIVNILISLMVITNNKGVNINNRQLKIGYKKRHIVARPSLLSLHDFVGNGSVGPCSLYTKIPGRLLEKYEQ